MYSSALCHYDKIPDTGCLWRGRGLFSSQFRESKSTQHSSHSVAGVEFSCTTSWAWITMHGYRGHQGLIPQTRSRGDRRGWDSSVYDNIRTTKGLNKKYLILQWPKALPPDPTSYRSTASPNSTPGDQPLTLQEDTNRSYAIHTVWLCTSYLPKAVFKNQLFNLSCDQINKN